MANDQAPPRYPDGLRPPPTLPDALSVQQLGFSLTEQELLAIRIGMSLHATSRQPRLTWEGWHHIASALAIGRDHAKHQSGGRMDTPDYRRIMSRFLRSSGFSFLNKADRTVAVRLLPLWEEIDAWRSGLPA